MKVTINNDIVRIIVKYLDKCYTKEIVDTMDVGGKVKSSVIIKPKLPTDYEYLKPKELLIVLTNEFGSKFDDEGFIKKLLWQIIKDWCFGKINKYGQLSVNHL